jgi:hypothetical protein
VAAKRASKAPPRQSTAAAAAAAASDTDTEEESDNDNEEEADVRHGRRNYKDTIPKCRLYWCLIEFIDRRYTVSHVGIFDPFCEQMAIYLLSDLPHPFPSFPK